MARYYVRRYVTQGPDVGRVGWVGPLPGIGRASREAAAWRTADSSYRTWTADVIPASPAVRAHVNAWQAQMDKDHDR